MTTMVTKKALSDSQVVCPGDHSEDISHYIAKASETNTPLMAGIALTHRCTFRCQHCYLGSQEVIRTHKDRELGTEAVLSLLDDLAAAGTLFLTFTGGDPMVRPDFAIIYEYAIKAGLLITVFCNGSLITEEIVELFKKYPPRMIEVSIYGATSETYSDVTLTANSFEQFTTGIDRLQKNNIRYRLKTMVMTLNLHELNAMRNYALERGVQFYHETSLIACLDNDDNNGLANSNTGSSKPLRSPLELRLAPERAAEIDASTDELSAALKNKAEIEPVFCHNEKLYTCGAARSSCFIDAYGNMQPCLVTNHICYDLQTGNFASGWKEISRRVKNQKITPQYPCNKCQHSIICTGCPASFRLETGNQLKPPPFYCNHAQRRSELVIVA